MQSMGQVTENDTFDPDPLQFSSTLSGHSHKPQPSVSLRLPNSSPLYEVNSSLWKVPCMLLAYPALVFTSTPSKPIIAALHLILLPALLPLTLLGLCVVTDLSYQVKFPSTQCPEKSCPQSHHFTPCRAPCLAPMKAS